MAVLIDSAAAINFKLTPEPVELSKREEGCLIWAGARQDISRHRRASESVVRQRKGVSGYGAPQIELHKLEHAVAVAIATGVIPAKALRQPC
jgi:hypothetical protein